MELKTQVGIIGAGPAGLLLQRILHNNGIESIILENRNEEYLRQRLRAGVQEQDSAETFIAEGVGDKLIKERMVHDGVHIHFNGERTHIDFAKLCDGRVMTVYGQRNITCDMIDVARRDGQRIEFEAKAQRFENVHGERPVIHFTKDGSLHTLKCDFIAGCDGFHGISRPSIPKEEKNIYEHVFPYSWYGILAEAAPVSDELIYAYHDDGFALMSMRSAELSRLYIQCPNGTEAEDFEENWLWDELDKRLGVTLNRGTIVNKGVAPMRSFVCDQMQHGKLYLAGDSAHIVPPAGAKGMNLAVSDVRVLSTGLINHYQNNDDDFLTRYTRICLRRIWKSMRFSWWMTTTLHKTQGQPDFDTQMQLATLTYMADSEVGARSFAENYVGLPIYWDA